MCQTSAYIMRDGQEELVLQDVITVTPEQGAIRMVNLFGEEKTVPGRIWGSTFLRTALSSSRVLDACGFG